MRCSCSLQLGGVLHHAQAEALATILVAHKPYHISGKMTVSDALERLCSPVKGWAWEFEGVPDGDIFPDLLSFLQTHPMDWAWCVTDDYCHRTAHLFSRDGMRQGCYPYLSDHECLALPIPGATAESLAEAQAWQVWLDSLELHVLPSAHAALAATAALNQTDHLPS